jgi:sulfotransferase family protein/methyltransferase family protein
MGVMVFGLARSGTTLVSDLLTIPGRSVVISEPEIFKQWSRTTAARVHRLARMVGLDLDDDPPRPEAYGASYQRYFDETLLPELIKLPLWGIKNVDFSGWRQLFKSYPPRRLILCVRDLRDTAISGLDRICRLGITFRGAGSGIMRDEAWVLAGLAYSVHELMEMRKLPHLLVRYEDLVADPQTRQRIAAYVGLDRLQEDRLNLRAAEMRRAWEIEKHQGIIGTASIGRFASEPPGPVRALAERLWQLLPEYSQAFGYETPPADAALRDHDFALSPRGGASSLQYLDTEAWNWEGPRPFEPSFAQRRARIAVAKAIPAGTRVLELGAGTPCLGRLLPSGATLVHGDSVARAPDFLVASLHQGDIPPVEKTDLIVILGMMEHVADPAALLAKLARTGRPVALSYHAADDTAGLDRRQLGWVSHLTRAELEAAFAAAGYRHRARWAFDGRQSLFHLTPAAAKPPSAKDKARAR